MLESGGVLIFKWFQLTAARRRLVMQVLVTPLGMMFQLTAARRRLDEFHDGMTVNEAVSTHSRPKAAGHKITCGHNAKNVSTHSRPKAAGTSRVVAMILDNVSTHSRPKAAG